MSETASSPKQQIRIRPTLILGLGGFGGEVMLKIRRRFHDLHGNLDEFPIVAYRWLDTDGKLDAASSSTRLGETERINLSVADPKGVTANLKEPSNTHIAPWWYPGLNSLSDLREGASQIRAYGRLAFFHHYTLIRSTIQEAQAKVRDPLAQEKMMKSSILQELGISAQVDFNSPTNVILISSISGGTGGGMLLDLAFMIKEMLGEGNVSSCAYLVFPESDIDDDHRGRANGYAFLKELNHYQYGVEHYHSEWSRGQQVKVATPPLDHCYLFDQVGPAQSEFSESEATKELLAEAIFQDFRQGEFSDHKRSVRVNLKQYMSKTFDYEHPRFKQKFIQRYGSLGMSSIEIPHGRIINACAAKLAATVVAQWLTPKEFAGQTRDAVLRQLGLLESENNHDILFPLLDPTGKADLEIGRTRGLMHELEGWGHHLLSEVEQQTYLRQRQTLRDWLHQCYLEKERQLRATNGPSASSKSETLPQPFQANFDALLPVLEARIRDRVGQLVEDSGLAAGASLIETLVPAIKQQLARFEAQSADLQEHTRLRQNDFHKRLTELARQQNRRNWDGRTKTVLRYLTERFLEALIGNASHPGLLRCQLQIALLRAGVEICKKLLDFLLGTARADGVRTGGIQAQLQLVERELQQLRQELSDDAAELDAPSTSPHTTSLYQAGEVDSKFYPAFVNLQVIEQTSKRSLQRLDRSLLSLSADLSSGGRELCKQALLTESRVAFAGIKSDFHLLKSFFQNFDAATRLEHLRTAFQSSKTRATPTQGHGAFRLGAEQVQILVGFPSANSEMDPTQRSEIDGYAGQLKQLMLRELKADLNFFDIPDASQLIFYQEVAGFPLNYLDRLSELRDSYLQLYTSGEPLHLTCHDKQFADLMILTPQEREALEEAHECLVLGCVFDILEYRSGDYLWIEKDVFQMRPHPLGDSSMLLLKLATHPQTRQRLMAVIREYRGQVLTSPLVANLARYAAVLESYKQAAWGDAWGKTSDESDLSFDQLMTLRILKSELDTVSETALIRAVDSDTFTRLVQQFFDERAEHFRFREDNRLAFVPQKEAPTPGSASR